MTSQKIASMAKKSLAVLNEVTNELVKGVSEAELVRRFGDKSVIPGVGVRQHIKELRCRGCLRTYDGKLYLKDECNPFKFIGAA